MRSNGRPRRAVVVVPGVVHSCAETARPGTRFHRYPRDKAHESFPTALDLLFPTFGVVWPSSKVRTTRWAPERISSSASTLSSSTSTLASVFRMPCVTITSWYNISRRLNTHAHENHTSLIWRHTSREPKARHAEHLAIALTPVRILLYTSRATRRRGSDKNHSVYDEAIYQ